jgi:ATP-dependent RNA helicase DeaD
MIDKYQQEHEASLIDVAAALAKMLQGDAPFLLQNKPASKPDKNWDREDKRKDRGPREDRGSREERRPRREQTDSRDQNQPLEAGMQRFRIEVGHDHKVKPGNIVGAIANEADIESKYIGRINIFDDHSLVDLPEGMPKGLFHTLKKARVMGQALNISSLESDKSAGAAKEEGVDSPKKEFKDKGKGKGKDKTSKFAKTEAPAKVRVKKRLRDDKNKGKPKRAIKKDI